MSISYCLGLVRSLALITSIRIVELLIKRIRTIPFAGRTSNTAQESFDENVVQFFQTDDDHDECVYYLRMLSDLIRYSPSNIWSALDSPLTTTSNNVDEPIDRM